MTAKCAAKALPRNKGVRPGPMWVVAATLPLALWGLLLLLPTFDDWVYYTTMYDGDLLADGYLLPIDNYWRPFDSALGALLGAHPWLFPSLNHIIVLAAHVASAATLSSVCRRLGMGLGGRSVAVLFFFFSPAMLGTVLGIDSPNQACSQLFALLALRAYLAMPPSEWRPWPAAACGLLVFVATLFKENGLAWALIPPVVAYAFGRCGTRGLARGLAVGALVCAAYAAARLALTPEWATVKDDYTSLGAAKLVRNACMFAAFTLLPADYVSIVHAPSRNLALAAATVLASLPMLFMALKAVARTGGPRLWVSLALCMAMAASPHLLTIYTTMHPYASLSIAAIMAGEAMGRAARCGMARRGAVVAAFALYMGAAVVTDAHHWLASYRSGLIGRRMADEIVAQTGGARPRRVFLITVDDGYKRYSSFCVVPTDAFGWGLAVTHRTGMAWPKEISNVSIPRSEAGRIPSMARKAVADGFDAVWLAEDSGAKVLYTKRQ